MVNDYYRQAKFLKSYSASIREMFEAGVHLGHFSSFWNPKMRSYIYGEYRGQYLIDLAQTYQALDKACNFLESASIENKNIVFVGTKKQATETVEAEAKRSNCHYVNRRWLGGMLTNYETIRLRINKLRELENFLDSSELYTLGKKEQAARYRQFFKLNKFLGGLKNLRGRPDVLCVVDQKRENTAILEARKLGITTIAIVDTDSDPTGIDYVIPANDDSAKAINLLFNCFANAIKKTGCDDIGEKDEPFGKPGVPKNPIPPKDSGSIVLSLPTEDENSITDSE